MTSANRENFTSSVPIWIPFKSFCHLTSVAKTSSTRLSRSVESGHPCLDFRGKTLGFSPLSMMLDVGLPYMTFIMLRHIPSKPPLLRDFFFFFYHEQMFTLSNAFSASIEMTTRFLSFLLLM